MRALNDIFLLKEKNKFRLFEINNTQTIQTKLRVRNMWKYSKIILLTKFRNFIQKLEIVQHFLKKMEDALTEM